MDLQFKNIEVDDIEVMMPFYMMRRNRTCDSVFLESFIWKDFYRVQYAIWEDKALLWLMEYGGKSFSAMPLCREEDLPGAFKAIETYFNETLGFPLVINLADEYAVQCLNLPESEYFVEEQVDSKDYLYTGDALRTLAGKKLHKKKNHVNSFMRQYGDRVEYRVLCCSDSHQVWEFLDKWRESKEDETEEHLDYEVRGIHEILKNCSNLNIRMGGVFIDDSLEAFSMGSYNPVENMAVIHIEKANPEINGLYQYINQQFLLAEFPTVDWVNREDDLGIEGLRKSKMSYYPADFGKKYLVAQIVDGKHSYKWAEEIGNTMAGEELVYLSGLEADETKKLWHDCFQEDSEGFINYYYEEKAKDNQLLIKKQNGFIAAMAHVNPYRLQMKNEEWDIGYVVGVATESSRRHKGHMRDILIKMINDMSSQSVPFTFLMPADKEIYLPFGFTFIYDGGACRLKDSVRDKLVYRTCADTSEDCLAAADYMEQWLEKRYEVYCKRDAAYVSRLIKEIGSEGGAMEFIINGEDLVGLRGDWGIEKKEQRLLYAEDIYIEEAESGKPSIMARITCVERFLSAFSLRMKDAETEKKVVLELLVTDPLIENNNRRFLWTLTGQGSHAEVLPDTSDTSAEGSKTTDDPVRVDIEKVAEAEVAAAELAASVTVLPVKIEDMASWLFGYKKPEQIWTDMSDDQLLALKAVDTVNGIFIDEIV